jgi:hypothetical protein
MEERKVTVILGDWSMDGHNITKKFHVKVSGNDVSDAVLLKNRERFTEVTGVELGDNGLFSEYENFSACSEIVEAMLDAGIVFQDYGFCGPRDIPFYVKTSDGNLIERLKVNGVNFAFSQGLGDGKVENSYSLSAVALLFSILGFGDKSFSYEIIPMPDYPMIVGSYRRPAEGSPIPLESFGYGLFN